MNGNLQPFQRGTLSHITLDEFREIFKNVIPEDEVKDFYEDLQKEEIWANDEYQVNIRKNIPAFENQILLWHLSVKRVDKEPVHDWRDLQEIKNMLVGKEYEAVELYPAETRKVDSANQYHLWVFYREVTSNEIPVLPFGWTDRYVKEDTIMGGKQRKF